METTINEIRKSNRESIERAELHRDKFIDWLSVWGPIACPLIPAVLTAIAIWNEFPELLGVNPWVALGVAIVTATGLEILGIVSVETWLGMRAYNITVEDAQKAPSGVAGFVVFLYCGVLLTLVVFLKMKPELAIWSLIPLTLMGLTTSWIVVLRKQHNERVYQLEIETNRDGLIEELQSQISELQLEIDESRIETNSTIQNLQFQNQNLQFQLNEKVGTIETLQSEIAELMIQKSSTVENKSVEDKPASNTSTDEKELAILRFIHQNPSITVQKDIADRLGFHASDVSKVLSPKKKDGEISIENKEWKIEPTLVESLNGALSYG